MSEKIWWAALHLTHYLLEIPLDPPLQKGEAKPGSVGFCPGITELRHSLFRRGDVFLSYYSNALIMLSIIWG